MSTTQQQDAPKCTAADGLAEIFNVPGHPLLVRAVDFNRLHAENETLRAGYDAAWLEIESLRADLRPGPDSYPVPQPAGEYPALPQSVGDAVDFMDGRAVDVDWSHPAPAGGTSLYSADQMRAYVDADRAMRVAQPAGAQVETAYGATEFGWTDWRDLQDGDKRLKALVVSLFGNDHQAFADLEALIDRAPHGQAPAQAAPAAVAGPSEFPHEQMDVMALARYKVMPSHESMLHRHVVVAGDGSQQLYIGREVECENMARKFAGAFLDGAFAFHSMLAAAPTTQPAPAVDLGALQAEIAGHEAANLHLSAMVDELRELLQDAKRAMTELHKAAIPDESAEGVPAIIPPDAFRAFVDAHAKLCSCLHQRGHNPVQDAQQPVAWQSRTRPTWGGDNRPWSPWEPCTKGQAEDCWKTPLLHEWAYEARALYAAPQPSPVAQGDALDAARLDFLIEHRAYVVSDDTCRDGYWLRFPVDGGTTSVQIGEYETPREAIDAARAAQEGK